MKADLDNGAYSLSIEDTGDDVSIVLNAGFELRRLRRMEKSLNAWHDFFHGKQIPVDPELLEIMFNWIRNGDGPTEGIREITNRKA